LLNRGKAQLPIKNHQPVQERNFAAPSKNRWEGPPRSAQFKMDRGAGLRWSRESTTPKGSSKRGGVVVRACCWGTSVSEVRKDHFTNTWAARRKQDGVWKERKGLAGGAAHLANLGSKPAERPENAKTVLIILGTGKVLELTSNRSGTRKEE